jgi:bifunctional non-homologous end joining protein LigD
MARRQPMTHGDMAVAASAPRAFRHPGWLFEPDYDGLRALARGGSTAWIVSTEGEDLARLFPEVRRALVRLPSCLLDGELVVTDFEGRPNGARLRQRCALEDREKIALASMGRPASFFAFDRVGVGGDDLRRTVPTAQGRVATG